VCQQPWLSSKQCAYAVLYCHLWPVWLHHIFPHYLIKGKIFRQTFLIIKSVFWFHIQHFSKTLFILNRNERYITINVHMSSCKIPFILVRFEWNLNFLERFKKNTQISNFMKICPVEAKLLCAKSKMNGWPYRQTDKWTNRVKLTVAFCNFGNVPKNWTYKAFKLQKYNEVVSQIYAYPRLQ
jgi:hypothetical protein